MATATEAEKLEKEVVKEPVSSYQLKRLLEGVEGIIERLPIILSRELQESAQIGTEEAISKMAQCLDAVKQFQTTMNQKQVEIEKHFDELWDAVKAKHAETNCLISELPKLAEIDIPYKLKDVISLAADCSHLTDKQWQRVLELARAFADK